jgi:hypothetical protein
MNQEKINFPEVRDFSGIFNSSVKFVSQNFKHFFLALIFIAGPFLLVDSVCMGLFQANLIDTTVNNRLTGFTGFNSIEFWSQFAGQLFILILVIILSRIILLTTTYAYVLAYNTYGPKNFGIAEVRKIVFQNIVKTIKGFFVCILLFFFLVLIFAIIGGLMATMLPLFTTIIFGFAVIAAIIISPPFIWQFSTFYLVQMKEDLGVLDSMRKVREIMRGEFFQTWLIIVVAALILIVLGFLFSAPSYIYQFILRMGGGMQLVEKATTYIIISTACGFLVKFLGSLMYIVNSFLYYSLDEKKNGAALISRIDEIGNTPVNDADQQY